MQIPKFKFRNRKYSFEEFRRKIIPASKYYKKKTSEDRLFHKPITKKKIVIYGLMALALAALIVAFRFIFVTMIDARAAFPDQTPVPTRVGGSAAPGESLSPEELLAMQADKDFMKNRVNILVAGIDYTVEREGREDFRTDTLMLFSVNFASGKVDIVSIPRDSYADIAFTNDRWKINGAWMSAGGFEGKGFDCMMETVATTLGGIPVNYYVAVEMQAVKDIVDALGGIYYDVDYEINLDGTHLMPGYQLLNGQDVLNYCRERKDITSGTDIDRIDRQQRLLLAVFSQLKSSNAIPKIPEIYNTLKSEIYTNLNFEQIAALMFFSLDLDPDTDLGRHALKGRYLHAYNALYYVLDHTYTKEVVKEVFGVDADIDWTYDIEYVEYDAAADTLEDAIEKTQSYYNKNKSILSPELISDAEAQIADANSTLSAAQGQLKSARNKNSSKGIKGTGSLTSAAKDMTSLYDKLAKYVSHPPKPTPTPGPSATPGPSSTPGPSATPGLSPTPSPSDPSASPSPSPSPPQETLGPETSPGEQAESVETAE